MASAAANLLSTVTQKSRTAFQFLSIVARKEKLTELPTFSPNSLNQAGQELSKGFTHFTQGKATLRQLGLGAMLFGEIAGFWCIGESLGRRRLIGYAY